MNNVAKGKTKGTARVHAPKVVRLSDWVATRQPALEGPSFAATLARWPGRWSDDTIFVAGHLEGLADGLDDEGFERVLDEIEARE